MGEGVQNFQILRDVIYGRSFILTSYLILMDFLRYLMMVCRRALIFSSVLGFLVNVQINAIWFQIVLEQNLEKKINVKAELPHTVYTCIWPLYSILKFNTLV